MSRPPDWDEKYGPWGTPPGYTPPMTATNNIQSPTGLRIGGVFSGIVAVSGIVFWYILATTGKPITAQMALSFFILVGVCSYMTWWCFHLANRRSKWARAKKSQLEQQPTEDSE